MNFLFYFTLFIYLFVFDKRQREATTATPKKVLIFLILFFFGQLWAKREKGGKEMKRKERDGERRTAANFESLLLLLSFA